MRTLNDINVKKKIVLLRADFNVPMKNGQILDNMRILKTLPTIHHLLDQNAKQIIIISHLGRPQGFDKKLSLEPVAKELSRLLNKEVVFVDDCLKELPTDKIILLENTRFYKEDYLNDKEFAKKLSHNADVYVFDAFGTAHRDQASTTGVAKFIEEFVFGLLMEQEIEVLSLKKIPKPFKAILGAAKVHDKIPVLKSLLKKVDKLLIGGAIVFTFLKALGYEVGKSLIDEESISIAKEIYDNYKDKIILPVDIVVAEREDSPEVYTVSIDKIPPNMKGLDIGDKSIELFKEVLSNAATIFWNGPLGLFEISPFDHATNEIAKYLASCNKITIVGGGDTEKAIVKAGIIRNFTHVSTGGGASLEFISGHKLPVLELMKEYEKKNCSC